MALTLTTAGMTAPDLAPQAPPELAIDPNDVFGMEPPDFRDDHEKAMDTWRQESAVALDAAVLDPKSYGDERIPHGYTPDEWRKTRVVDDWMRLHTDGQEPPMGPLREFERGRLAQQAFGGAGADSDESLFTEITGKAQKRKDTRDLTQNLRSEAYSSAVIGGAGEKSATFAEWKEQASKLPGYDATYEGTYFLQYQNARQEAKERLEPVKGPLKEVWDAMKQGGAGSPSEIVKELLPFASVIGDDLVDEIKKKDAGALAFEHYNKLDEQGRAAFMDGLHTIIQQFPKEQRPALLATWGKSFGSVIDDMGRGAMSRFTMKGLEEHLNRGVAGSAGPWGASDADKAEATKRADALHADNLAQQNFMKEVRRMERDEYAPTQFYSDPSDDVFSLRRLESGFYGSASAAASVAVMATPIIGYPTLALAMEDFAYNDLRANAMRSGASEADSTKFADEHKTIAAVPQLAEEIIQNKLALGKIPAIRNVLTRIGDKITSRIARGAISTAAFTTAESAVEEVQYLTPYVVQDLAAAFEADTGIPAAEWSNGKNGALDGFWARQAETFISMLPMGIGGAAGGLNREARNESFRQATTLELQSFGFKDEDIANIQNAPGPSSLAAGIDKGLENRDPNSPEAQAATEKRIQRIEQSRRAATLLEDMSYSMPAITAMPDGSWIVRDNLTGEEVGRAKTSTELDTVVRGHSLAMESLQEDEMLELVTWLGAAKVAAKNSGMPQELNLSRYFGMMDVEAMGPKAMERFMAEVALQEQAEGGDGSATRAVFGMNVTEIRDGQKQLTNKMFKGANIGLLFHENWHAARSKGKAAGIIKREDDIRLLRAFDAVLKGKTREVKREDGSPLAPATRKSFLPDGIEDADISETMLDEAIAEVAEVLTFLFPRGHKTNKHGLRRELVSKHLGAVGRLAPEPTRKFGAFIRAIKAKMGLAMSRAYHVKKAIAKGELDPAEIDTYMGKLFGTDEQAEHDTGVQAELERILNMDENVEDDNIPFAVGRVDSVSLPATTQKSRTIADPALEIGNKPVQEYSIVSIRAPEGAIGNEAMVGSEDESVSVPVYVSIRNPGNRDDLSPRGDGETDTRFSIGRAREKWVSENNKLHEARVARLTFAPIWSQLRMGGQSFGTSPASRFVSQWLIDAAGGSRDSYGNPFVSSARIREELYPLIQNMEAGINDEIAQAEAAIYLLEEEFDPETDARLADAEKLHERELSKHAAMFAALLEEEDEKAKNAAKSFVARVWNAYAQHDEIFQYGKTTSKSAADIAAAVSTSDRMVTVQESDNSIRIMGNNGFITLMDTDTARPYISAPRAGSKGKKDGGGSQLYVVALDWIHNNGKRIKDDPDGITGINMVRRTSNFFASAIRWGTTKHLKPHADQKVGKWTKNDVLNTSLLATKEMKNVHKAIPETRGWTYDFAGGKFLAANGSELTKADFDEVVKASDPENSGIGVSTLQRAVITSSAIQAFQRGTSADTLLAAESDLASELHGVSYAIGRAEVASRMQGGALSLVRDPIRRVQAMSRMARDFGDLSLRFQRIEALAGRRMSKGQLRQEANAREDMAADEKIGAVWARYGSLLADDDLTRIKSQPVHAYLSVKRADGKPDPLHGRIMSKVQAMKRYPERYALHRGGEYDGADNISRSIYGGQLMPDQAAQELFDAGLISEPYTDAMWEALEREQNSVIKNKEALAKALEEIREAKREAKREASEWLATQGKEQETNYNPKQEILASLRMLDAILLALPPEIRGKIGGYTQMAMIATDEARLAFLKDKLKKADKELETFLRESFNTEWLDLLKRAKPDKDNPGQRPIGQIDADALDILRAAESAMWLDFSKGEAEADRLDALAEHEDTKPEDADKLRATAQMVRLTTNWSTGDAARREQAVIEGTRIYYGGLMALRVKNSARAERLRGLQTSAKQGTGQAGDRMDRKKMQRKEKAGRAGQAGRLVWEFLSFGQLTNVLFGESSAVAKWFNAKEIAASNAYEDGVQAKAEAIESMFESLSGSRFNGEKLRHRMQTKEAIQTKDAHGNEHTFTEAEGISFLLMWRQEDGKRHMEGQIDDEGNLVSEWGWTEQAANDIESQLTPEAKSMMAFLGTSYGEEYGRINDVFRRIWNVSMPRHKFYAPLTVKPSMGKQDAIVDPVSGDSMGVGMTPGSLKNRSQTAVTEPDFRDAFQVFLTHARQMEHFISYAEFARDAMAVVNRREIRNSIEAVSPTAATALGKWVDYFALGGLREAAAGGAWQQFFAGALSRLSSAALVGRVSVLGMQTLQLGAAAYKMPLGAYLSRFARLLGGRLAWGDALRSDYIQRRMLEMPPVVRDAVMGLAAGTPNRAKYLATKAARGIAGADGLFTAGTYAILYDYHLTQARKAGIPNPESHAHAEAERLTDQVAQPMRTGARSWLEISMQNQPAFRALWNFSTDPRQKISLLAYAALRHDVSGKDKAAAVGKAVAVTWAVSGILQAVLRSVFRDLRNDDDDELFDERHWDLKRLGLMASVGPIGGIPYLGGMIESSIYNAAGEWKPANGLLDALSSSVPSAQKLATLESDDVLKDIESVLSGGATISGTSAAGASAMHAVRDAVNIYENFDDD